MLAVAVVPRGAQTGLTLTGWPGLLLAIFGLIGIAVGVVAYFKSTFARQTIDDQHKLIEAQRDRLDDLDRHVAKCDRDVAELTRANQVLSDQVSGTTAVRSLTAVVTEHFKEVLDVLDAQAQGIGELNLQLRRINGPKT